MSRLPIVRATGIVVLAWIMAEGFGSAAAWAAPEPGGAVAEAGQTGAARPRVKRDARGELVPDVRAAAAIIYDPIRGEVLWEEHSDEQRSIASITKVMTAVVFMESGPDLAQSVTIESV